MMNDFAKELTKFLVRKDDEVEFRIRTGTEMYRKGFGEIRLTGPDGKPVPRAKIRLKQKTHEFLFGCNAFMLNQFPEAEQNRKYEEVFASLFNEAVVPFYWSDLEPEEGELRFKTGSRPVYRRPPTDEVVEFCSRNGILPKGHPLCWHCFKPAWLPNNPAQVMRKLDRRMAQIEAGIQSTPVIQVVVDAANVNTAGAATAYLQGVLLGSVSQQAMFESRMLFNPQMKSAYNFVPGIMGLIFILVCAMMTSVSIVREREVGTMEVLLVSPVRPVKIIFAKMIPYFAISCIVLTTILLLAHFLLGVPMSGGVEGIVAISLLYLVLALSLGLLVSTIAKTQVAALLVSAVVMMMPILMLSGMLFPIENLPKFFQVVSHIVPARWYIDAIRKMMIQGVPLIAVWKDFVILLGMTIVLISVSLKKFNDKLE